MVELFPEGFEETEHSDGVELAAYTDASGEERLWAAFGTVSADAVPDGWEQRWREFHKPVRVGRLWLGPPWENPPADALAVVIDPGRAFGTGGHPTTRLCLELLAEVEPASLVDAGCGSGVIAVAAAKLGFSPVRALDQEAAAVEATARNAAANGVELEIEQSDVLSAPLPEAEVLVANVSGAFAGALRPHIGHTHGSHVGLPRVRPSEDRPLSPPGAPHRARVGRRPAPPRGVESTRRGGLFHPLSGLQGVVRRRPGDPRAPARGRPYRGGRRSRGRGREHVLRDARGGPQVAPCRRPRSPHARQGLRHRLRREPRG